MVVVVIVWCCEWQLRLVEFGENARWQNREIQEAAFELVRRFKTDSAEAGEVDVEVVEKLSALAQVKEAVEIKRKIKAGGSGNGSER
ncbi:uncharacterized protein MONOS_4688 [Monocercomonoides exilis]|uniref:uncharacterized protein n=1 Tax=Monocercomonoides exilis TaxID=2049356 RepID=UPI003559E45C|nr:hypothetical protein MONOS_4688 [Monocercomonoides exilis]|eukprot:MONOS_4688.1-p1 / transcript=MONOS_4688.1 / gene=MONOS_4688 / organism=Monocercomonoides_exilis_PA203 / gene_product=unspecified product / transcript_product=unspecified product / location=Mono_scaffold00127:73470-73730(-) / protein_length=87 / sequence_SO=supercontig / SO=protein_coding / is_pseudo=false